MPKQPAPADRNQRILANAMLEDVLLAKVIKHAQGLGWRVAHFRPAKTKQGWRTAVQGDGKGFPDIIAVRGGRQIVAECKTMRGSLTSEQKEWLARFQGVPTIEVYVWRPLQWLDNSIQAVLA